MNELLGILLALAAVVVPLLLVWYLLARHVEPHGARSARKRQL